MSASGGGGGTSGGVVWTHVGHGQGGSLGMGGRSAGVVGGAGGGISASDGRPTLTLDPVLGGAIGALVDLFDGNNDVARTVQYDRPDLSPERCAEIAEVVEACRRWRNGGGT